MQAAMNRPNRYLVCTWVLAAVAGCTTTGPTVSVDLSGPEREAQAYAEAGDTASAVAIYNDLYSRSTGSQSDSSVFMTAAIMRSRQAST